MSKVSGDGRISICYRICRHQFCNTQGNAHAPSTTNKPAYIKVNRQGYTPTPYRSRGASCHQRVAKGRGHLKISPIEKFYRTVANKPEMLKANENVEIHENSRLNSCLYPILANSSSSAVRIGLLMACSRPTSFSSSLAGELD